MGPGPFRPENRYRGFSLLEVVFTIAILAAIVAVAAYSSFSSRSRSLDFSRTTDCYALAENITGSVTAMSNALIVRDWRPSASTSLSSAMNQQDPFCNTNNNRTAVCDTLPLVTMGQGTYAAQNQVSVINNVRSAGSWAQSVYNTYRGNGICSVPGMILTPTALGNLLPTQTILPAWVSSVQLYMKDRGVACGALSANRLATFEMTVTVRYQPPQAQPGIFSTCASTVSLSNPSDNIAPKITLTSVRNADGEDIPAGACSYRKTYPQYVQSGNNPGGYRTVSVTLGVNEPGNILLCRKASAFELDPVGSFWNCPDLNIASATVSTTPATTATFINSPQAGVIQMQNMLDRGNLMYAFEYKSVDVGSNHSNVVSVPFRVKIPNCARPRGDYCPNAVAVSPAAPAPAPPAPWNIMSLPYDDCLNGTCEQGTHSYCNPNQIANTCQGVQFNDDCGLPNCTGQMQPNCNGINLANVPCGQYTFGACGANCGPGTMNCATPAPQPTPGPTPAPGCDCTAVNLSAVACDAYVNDSCGQPTCGPGTMACPTPTPTPTPVAQGPCTAIAANGISINTCCGTNPVPCWWPIPQDGPCTDPDPSGNGCAFFCACNGFTYDGVACRGPFDPNNQVGNDPGLCYPTIQGAVGRADTFGPGYVPWGGSWIVCPGQHSSWGYCLYPVSDPYGSRW